MTEAHLHTTRSTCPYCGVGCGVLAGNEPPDALPALARRRRRLAGGR